MKNIFSWKQYTSFAEFQADTIKDLLFNKYQNNKILRIITKFKDESFNGQIRLVVLSKDDKNVLIGVQTLPHQMLFYFCNDTYNEDALRFYIDKVTEARWDLQQIMGEENIAGHFARVYSERTGKTFHNFNNYIVYRLDKLCKDKMPAGRFREFNMDDMNIIPYCGRSFLRSLSPPKNIMAKNNGQISREK